MRNCGYTQRKSRSAGTSDPKEAEAKRVDLESDLNNDRHFESARMAWEKFRKLFETEYVSGLRTNTRENHEDTLNLFEQLCSPRRLDLITARTVSAFVAEMRTLDLPGGKKGMAPSTIKVRLQFLRTALRWAVDQELLKKCPKFPVVKVPQKRPQPVSPEAFERLLDKAPDQQMRAYLLCGWLAGMRLSEAFELEREPTNKAPYLDLERDRIIFPAEVVKGVADQWVALDPKLREALEALPRHGRKVFRFLDPRDGHQSTVDAVSHRIVKLAHLAGVKMTMRTLRRGFGCRYAARVPAQVLQRIMRHSNIQTTMAFYVNVDEAAEEAILGPKCNRKRNTPPPNGLADAASPALDQLGDEEGGPGREPPDQGRLPGAAEGPRRGEPPLDVPEN